MKIVPPRQERLVGLVDATTSYPADAASLAPGDEAFSQAALAAEFDLSTRPPDSPTERPADQQTSWTDRATFDRPALSKSASLKTKNELLGGSFRDVRPMPKNNVSVVC